MKGITRRGFPELASAVVLGAAALDTDTTLTGYV